MTTQRRTAGETSERLPSSTFMAAIIEEMMGRCAAIMRSRMRTTGGAPTDDDDPEHSAESRCGCGECHGGGSSAA